MRRKIIAGNWKMNGSRQFAVELVEKLQPVAEELSSSVEVVVAPPYVLMTTVGQYCSSGLKMASQDVSSFDGGAYTGEISADMLVDMGCRYSIVGHSERRALFGDTNELVAKKVVKSLEKDIAPILCVGETLEERETGKTLDVIREQIVSALKELNEQQLKNVVVAYEPVWAIGTGKTATPEQAQEVHAFIRKEIAGMSESVAELMPIIYGGSVKADNAVSLFAMNDIDGGLVGGASLKFEEFAEICKAIG